VDLDPTPLVGVHMVALRCSEYKGAVFALNLYLWIFPMVRLAGSVALLQLFLASPF